MAGNSNYATIETTSLPYFSKKLQELISGRQFILAWLMKKGMKRDIPGGTAIIERLNFTENSTFGPIAPFGTVNMTLMDPLTAAQFAPKVYAGSMQVSELQRAQNSGSEQKISDLVTDLLDNLIISAKKQLDAATIGDGTASNGLAIGGLQLLVEDGTAYQTVGNIDSNTYTQWRNQWAGSVGSAAANLLKKMNEVKIDCGVHGYQIDLVITEADARVAYEQAALQVKRIVKENAVMADLGFRNTEYDGAPIIDDVNVPAGYMWMLSSGSLHWNVYKGYDLNLSPMVQPYNQLVKSRLISFIGNMSIKDRAANGLLTGITYP